MAGSQAETRGLGLKAKTSLGLKPETTRSQLVIQGGQGRGREALKATCHGSQTGSLCLVVLVDLLHCASIILDYHHLFFH